VVVQKSFLTAGPTNTHGVFAGGICARNPQVEDLSPLVSPSSAASHARLPEGIGVPKEKQHEHKI
jgi:hypothetical protein